MNKEVFIKKKKKKKMRKNRSWSESKKDLPGKFFTLSRNSWKTKKMSN